MNSNKKEKNKGLPFVIRLCFSLEQTDRPWCEFCGEQFAKGFKLCRNGKGDAVFVCDDCLKKAT